MVGRRASSALALAPGDPAGVFEGGVACETPPPPPPPDGSSDASGGHLRPFEALSQALPPPAPPAAASSGGAGGAVLAWAGALLGPAVDSALGRAAHVAFLESPHVAALVALGLRRLWEA